MRLGLAAWGMRNLDMEEKFAMTKRLGLSMMECSIGGFPTDFLQKDATDSQIALVRNLAGKYGISLECACTGNNFTAADLDAQIELVIKVLGIAAKLDVKKLRIFAGFASDSEMDEKRKQSMLQAIRQSTAEAKKLGITAAVETHGGVAAVNSKEVRHFASFTTRCDNWDVLKSAGADMLFDPANLDAVGQSAPERFYEKFKDIITVVHLKDFIHTADGVIPAACGEGGLDWSALCKVMEDYQGPALVEYENPEDVEAGFRRSLDFLKGCGF